MRHIIENNGLFNIYLLQIHPVYLYIGLAICAIIPYLLGSLNFALIISKFFYHDDIRKYGSSNAGMTNMMRTYGKGAALGTLLGDAGKAALSALVGYLILGETGAYVAGLFCIIGHVFPIYYKFKGGKGIITTAIMVLCLNPLVFSILLVIFICIVIGTKYISLGSIMCMMIYPLLLSRLSEPNIISISFSIFISLFVIFLHRENIVRLWHGEESKFSFKKKNKK